MKKIVLLLCLVVLLTGCSVKQVQYDNIDSIIESVLTKKIKLSNSYFDGYKYYLPRGLRLVGKKGYNAKLVSGKDTYYLYVDVIAYYNKVDSKFTPSDGYYSKELNFNNKKGYIEITETEDLYFVEIMYNYSKIETLVEKKDLNTAIINACYILSSVQFNDKVIETLIGENALDYKETIFNIFGPHRDTDEFLKYEEDYQYKGDIDSELNKKDSDILKTETNE